MKIIGISLILFVLGISSTYSQPSFNEFMEQQKKESIEFNATVTDKEIIDFLEFQYEIDPVMLKQLQDTKIDPEKLKTFLSNYRKSYKEAGMKLPTLRGLPEKEISELRATFEFKKKEYYETIDVENRLQSLSYDQLVTIMQEGAKLVENYDTLKQETSERVVKITDNFPSPLNFLQLRLIYLTDMNCQLFLQKGIGKGIGFSVSKEKGEWKLWSFNQYKSWDRQEIVLQ